MSSLYGFDIDAIAVAGFNYAAGRGGIPPLEDQLDIDAFNVGIVQYNDQHGTKVTEVFETQWESRHDVTFGRADKDLAIVCNH
ncbi:hypothetical protein [Paucibacter soli]|uniref:hypothetical protein n=1 Tax=Paucibacter soli TaxID=3133433 RepID=UPI0030AD32FE